MTTTVKERPILMNGAMVRAVLEGRKTQTRRLLKIPHYAILEERDDGSLWPWMYADNETHGDYWLPCPFGIPGDRLWVRETFAAIVKPEDATDGIGRAWYYTDTEDAGMVRWTPSIHMPRWASRITLENVSVRVERLHDITVSDAIAEGYDGSNPTPVDPSIKWYADLWKSINGPGSWDANPWVWVIEFKVIKP